VLRIAEGDGRTRPPLTPEPPRPLAQTCGQEGSCPADPAALPDRLRSRWLRDRVWLAEVLERSHGITPGTPPDKLRSDRPTTTPLRLVTL
jgi:hypothetical protein